MTAFPVAALIVAAGRGTRMGDAMPKQYLRIGGRSVLSRTLEAFLGHPLVDRSVVVIHAEDGAPFAAALAETPHPKGKLCASCHGGETRQESVAHGLKALADSGFPPEGIVLIHDAARPFVPEAMITRAIAALKTAVAISP